MKENAYKQARLRAAETDPGFSTVEQAYQSLNISREKLLMIEQSAPGKRKADPNPDEVVRMAKVYHAPELLNYYCANQCPIGEGMPELMHENLDQISVHLMSALHYLTSVNDRIYSILEDGQVSESERQEFGKILNTLNKIAYSANSLELWAKKNGLTEKR